MRDIRIYTDQALSNGVEVTFETQAPRHLVSVLRLTVGDAVTLFNGLGGAYLATLTTANNKNARALISEHQPIDCESPLKIHLGIGLSRGDRMDWVVQKATELGVNAITPLYTERTEVKLKGDRAEKKLHHWQQVTISACEQSGRNYVPQITAPTLIDNWFDIEAEQKFVLHHRSDGGLNKIANTPASVALLIGPEGGLSDREIELSLQNNFQALTLGPRVLRTETAPLAAISILQALWGDMS